MSGSFIVQNEVESEIDINHLKSVFPVSDRVTPKEKFRSAIYILSALWIFYIIAMFMYFYGQDEHSKLLFTTTKELIMHFGGLLIGFYFSKKI
jgi:hypothetical protein